MYRSPSDCTESFFIRLSEEVNYERWTFRVVLWRARWIDAGGPHRSSIELDLKSSYSNHSSDYC